LKPFGQSWPRKDKMAIYGTVDWSPEAIAVIVVVCVPAFVCLFKLSRYI